jgi:predicted dehydrogenase
MIGRITGSRGTVWTEGDTVHVADKNGTRRIDVPEDLHVAAPDPPPADLLVTTYDFLHSMGIDYGPYVRLFDTFRDLIARQPVPADPRPATFADGVANMVVLDAIRRSAAERSWVTIA